MSLHGVNAAAAAPVFLGHTTCCMAASIVNATKGSGWLRSNALALPPAPPPCKACCFRGECQRENGAKSPSKKLNADPIRLFIFSTRCPLPCWLRFSFVFISHHIYFHSSQGRLATRGSSPEPWVTHRVLLLKAPTAMLPCVTRNRNQGKTSTSPRCSHWRTSSRS